MMTYYSEQKLRESLKQPARKTTLKTYKQWISERRADCLRRNSTVTAAEWDQWQLPVEKGLYFSYVEKEIQNGAFVDYVWSKQYLALLPNNHDKKLWMYHTQKFHPRALDTVTYMKLQDFFNL